MNKHISKYLLIAALILISLPTLASVRSFESVPEGRYAYTQIGDELIDGSITSITWTVVFLSERKAKILISSWHEPFTCDGYYNANYSGGLISLTWAPEDNSETECDAPTPQFILKQTKSRKMEINSQLFGLDSEEWVSLKSIR